MIDPDPLPTRYPHLRQCLGPDHAALPDAALDQWLAMQFGPRSAEQADAYLEGFFDDVGRVVSRAAPVVASVGGGIARGAMAGSALGLPGIVAGALAGGAGSALSRYGPGSLRDVGRALNGVTGLAGSLTPMGQLGGTLGSALDTLGGAGRAAGRGAAGMPGAASAPGGGALTGLASALGSGGGLGGAMAGLGGAGSAASQLMNLLGRPELQQALTALQLGSAGRRSIPVGAARQPVPTTAIAGLLRTLAGRALGEAAAEADGAESALDYMSDGQGRWLGDPTHEDDRASRVWDLLDRARQERALAVWQQAAALDAYRAGYGARAARSAGAGAERDDLAAAQHLAWWTEDLLEDFVEDTAEAFDEGWADEADPAALEALLVDEGESLLEAFDGELS